MDRLTGRVVRRIETHRCAVLVHIDFKKLARVPDGGGHRMLGRTTETMRRARVRAGYTHIHTAIDAHSHLAYSRSAGSAWRGESYPGPGRHDGTGVVVGAS